MNHTTCTTTTPKHLLSCLRKSYENGGGVGNGSGM